MNSLMNKRILVILLTLLIYGMGCATQGAIKVYEVPPPSIPTADNKLFAKALAAQNAGQVKVAIKQWKRFLARHPNSFEARNNLGMVYYTENQVTQALQEFDTAYRLEPISEKIRKNLSRALAFQADLLYESKEYDRVIRNLKRLKEVSPPKEQQGLDIKMEQVEDAIYEQVQRADTARAYEDFIRKYPIGLNADAAKKRLLQLSSKSSKTITLEGAMPVSPRSGLLTDGGPEGPGEEQAVIHEENSLPEPPAMETMDEEMVIEEEIVPPSILPDEMSSSRTETLADIQRDPNLSSNDFSAPAEALNTLPGTEALMAVAGMEAPIPLDQVVEVESESWPATIQEYTSTIEEPEFLVTPQFLAEPEAIQDEVMLQTPVMAPFEIAEEFDPVETAQLTLRESKIRIQVDTFLNVRAAPSTKGKIVGQLNNGEERPLLSEKSHWFQIEFAEGRTGWVHRKFARKLKIQSLPSVAPSGFNSGDRDPRIPSVAFTGFNYRRSGQA